MDHMFPCLLKTSSLFKDTIVYIVIICLDLEPLQIMSIPFSLASVGVYYYTISSSCVYYDL